MVNIKYLLSLNRYSRSGVKTNIPKKIVLHQSENERFGAIETRNYFDNLKLGKNAVYYSTHYIVGLEGEIICCVPENEIANHRGNSKESNGYISITCCSADNSREPSVDTVTALKALVRDISLRHGFDPALDFVRHYDLSGIKCPLFYVEHEEKWLELKEEIVSDIETSRRFSENSDAVSSTVSRLTGVDKSYLKLILEGKAAPCILRLSKIFDTLLMQEK